MAKSRTQQYYDKNPDAKKRKAAYEPEPMVMGIIKI